ncbi:MAG: outer membrane beta-barrel protein [Gemmatimonadota bacterium]
MKNAIVGRFAAVAVLTFATAASAQRRSAPSVANITPYAGYMTFGSYVDGPLGTSIGNAPAPVIGAQLGIDLMPMVSFVGNVGFASTKLRAGVPILGGFDLADTKVLMYDAGLELRIPETASLGFGATPFIQAGAGAMRTEVSLGSLDTKSTSFAWNYGGGVDMKLGSNLGLKLMARDYVAKLDLKEATQVDINTRTTHNWAFSAGVKVSF